MNLWYSLLDWLPLPWLTLDFMKNALLAVLIMGPLFGLLSTMVVTGRMSFFSDALGHSGFTGIAIGVLCGAASPTWFAVALAVAFATTAPACFSPPETVFPKCFSVICTASTVAASSSWVVSDILLKYPLDLRLL